MAEILPVCIPLGGGASVAATAGGAMFHPGRKFELLGVRFGGPSAITGHASNFAAVQVVGSDETSVIWEWSTDSAKEGTVAASTVYYTSDEEAPGGTGDTAQDFDAAETKTLRTYDANQGLEVNITKGGSGVAIIDAALTLLIRYL